MNAILKMKAILKETTDKLEAVEALALSMLNANETNTRRMADLYASVGYAPKPGANSMFLDPERCERTRQWIKGETPNLEGVSQVDSDLEKDYAKKYLDTALGIMMPELGE